jgi:hypothetical protein
MADGAAPQPQPPPEQRARFVEILFRHYIFNRSEEKTLQYLVSKVLPKIKLFWHTPDGKERTFTPQSPPSLADIREVTARISTTYHEDYVQALAIARERIGDIPLTERAERINAISKEVADIDTNIEMLQEKVRAAIPKDTRTPAQARAYEADAKTLNHQLSTKREYLQMLDKMMVPLEEDVPLEVTHDNVHDVAAAIIGSVQKWQDGNLLPPILVDNAEEILKNWQAASTNNRS